jgi:tRNA(fMet)-specific endonuclease VapC
MIVLLDTNVFVTFMRDPVEFRKFSQILETKRWTVVYMSSVSLFELEMGVQGRQGESDSRARLSAILGGPIEIVSFSEKAAVDAAMIATRARATGRQLSAIDALIAGHAAALGVTLVTDDARLAAAVGEIEVVRWR